MHVINFNFQFSINCLEKFSKKNLIVPPSTKKISWTCKCLHVIICDKDLLCVFYNKEVYIKTQKF